MFHFLPDSVMSRCGIHAPSNFYHWKGTPSEFRQFYRDVRDAGAPNLLYWEKSKKSQASWAGFEKGSFDAMLDSGISIDAQTAFDKALAAIHAEGKPNTPEYRVTGGVWSVPRYLTGHPQCAIYRPRTALPPKTINIVAFFSAFRDSDDVARPLARIARACWEYQKAGGSVSLVVNYCGRFRQAIDGHNGFIASIRVPLSNVSAIATACSVQWFRTMFLDVASGLSPATHDAIPPAWPNIPGAIRIEGDRVKDDAALKSAGIK